MKAINTPTSKALRILDNIMERHTEWFAKDEHHSASLEYSRVGGDCEIFTAKFYGTGAKVRKLNFTDIDDALGYLASNHYYNVASNPQEQPEEPATTEPASPYADFIGKKLHSYDSWYGEARTVKIESATEEDKGVRFKGANGCRDTIYVGKEYIAELREKGRAEQHQEVDHCDVKTSWTILR